MQAEEDPIEITLVLTKETFEKFQELAGSDSNFSEYLTTIIQMQYTQLRVFGNTYDLEQLISMAEKLAQQNKAYHTVVGNLRQQYNRLALSQEELLATLAQVKDTTSELLKNSRNQNVH